MDQKQRDLVFRPPARRLTTRIGDARVSYGSYYATEHHDVWDKCRLCHGSGWVLSIWYRKLSVDEQRRLLRAGRPVVDEEEVQEEQECYRCEGTGTTAKEWRKPVSIDEARAIVKTWISR